MSSVVRKENDRSLQTEAEEGFADWKGRYGIGEEPKCQRSSVARRAQPPAGEHYSGCKMPGFFIFARPEGPAVHRPGRKAGNRIMQRCERRRRGTASLPIPRCAAPLALHMEFIRLLPASRPGL